MPLIASPSVVRAGHVLGHLAAHPTSTFSASDLARTLGIPRATCNSLLLGLAELGMVRRDDSLAWSLGRACIALGDAARIADPALRIASSHAEELSRSNALTTAVSIRDAATTRVAAVFESAVSPTARPHVGDSVALVPPFGVTTIAWSSDEEIDRWLDRATPALDESERSRYRVAIEAVRERGYSIAVASDPQARFASALERLGDDPAADVQIDVVLGEIAHSDYLAAEVTPTGPLRVTQLSSPVFDAEGRVAASIMVLGPDHDLSVDDAAALGRLLLDTTRRATQSLGGVAPERRR